MAAIKGLPERRPSCSCHRHTCATLSHSKKSPANCGALYDMDEAMLVADTGLEDLVSAALAKGCSSVRTDCDARLQTKEKLTIIF